jgi:tetratricopeptide (TPR) repeat protein
MKISATGVHWGLLGLVLLVIGLGVIPNTSPPVLDDNNEWEYLASWTESGRISALDCFGYFRPIKNLFFALCAPASDGSIVAAHVASLAAYVLLMLVIWLAARRLLGHERWALALTVLYALAPTQLSCIAWFSCTTNVVMNVQLVLLTLMAAENACQQWREQRTRFAMVYGATALLCAALALVSYEVAVSLPALFLLWQYARERSWSARPTLFMAGLLALTVLGYMLVRFKVQGITSSSVSGFFPPMSAVEVSSASAYFTLHHLGLWLWPWDRLTLFTGYPPADTLPAFLIPASWVVLLVITWLAFRLRDEIRFLWIGWLWFLCAFLPMSNLIPFRNGPFADYYLALPSFGLALAAADVLRYCAHRWREQTSRLAVAIGLALVFARVGAAIELPRGLWAWRETHSLNRYLLHADPLNYVVLANWGNFCIQARQLDTADKLAAAAQQMAPWFDYAVQLRGQIALARTNYPAAFQFYEQAHRLNPTDAFPLKAQGFIREQQGRANEALAFYQQSLKCHWDSDSVKLAIHVVRQLNTLGRTNEAAALFARAEHYAPHHWAVVLYKHRPQPPAR